ncbi:MAG: S-layer homology domain-containing protein [Clostridia bacterium]|nr:S-layer homology domain-containing protein [Clostridia bacterium]
MLKKLICTALSFILLSSASAGAEFIPEKNLTMLEAMEIYDAGTVTGGYMMSLEKAQAMKLSGEQINKFISLAGGMTLERRIVKNPFSGVCIVLQTTNGERTYFLNSGVQVGKFGQDNYLCYTASEDNDIIGELYVSFMSSPEKYGHSQFTINESMDFLEFPSEKWAVTEVLYSASNSLLPYGTMEWFGRSISREAFCVMIANLIAVNMNYAKLEDYFRESGTAYLTNYFTDTQNCDSSINMLHALGIVNGKSDELFAPGDALTREEAAVIIKKTAELLKLQGVYNLVDFADLASVSKWAADAVNFVGANKIMTGTDGMFNPSQLLTTEQAVAGINRLYRLGSVY